MKLTVFFIIMLCFAIIYLLHKIEKQKTKIIYLLRQNSLIVKEYNRTKLIKNSIDNISNTDIKFVKIEVSTAFLKNTASIKIAPFDFAPKIVNIQKNTEIKILSKIFIKGEYWYEIIVNDVNLSYNLKGWIKDYGIEFIYPRTQDKAEIN